MFDSNLAIFFHIFSVNFLTFISSKLRGLQLSFCSLKIYPHLARIYNVVKFLYNCEILFKLENISLWKMMWHYFMKSLFCKLISITQPWILRKQAKLNGSSKVYTKLFFLFISLISWSYDPPNKTLSDYRHVIQHFTFKNESASHNKLNENNPISRM